MPKNSDLTFAMGNEVPFLSDTVLPGDVESKINNAIVHISIFENRFQIRTCLLAKQGNIQ